MELIPQHQGGIMADQNKWDWEIKEKKVPIGEWKEHFEWVEEPYASPDGEKVAAVVNIGEGEFNVCINGETWENPFEKIWYVRFSPDGRLTALVSDTGEWTVAVDGVPWENKFGYVWNTMFGPNGKNIAVAAQQDGDDCMVLHGDPWEEKFKNMTSFAMSQDGTKTAAAVQVEGFGEGEIHKFQQGCFTAAMDGQAWDNRFVNVWNMAISPDNTKLAAEGRVNLYGYTIAGNA